MTTDTRTKPQYLGLLNAISLAERNAGIYLTAWAQVTPDPELQQTLALVAAREAAHGEVFRQRIERLGFTLREREDPDLERRVRFYGDPTIPDVDKIRAGRRDEDAGERADPLVAIDERINDGTVDPLTRDTLRWFVAEERDSGDLLKAAYAQAEAATGGAIARAGAGGHPSMVSADTQALMACMTQGFAALQESIRTLAVSLQKREKDKQR